MSGFGTDVLALACILGGATASGALTAALLGGAHDDIHLDAHVGCAVETVHASPQVVVALGSSPKTVVVGRPHVRVHTTHDCASAIVSTQVEASLERAREAMERARGRTERVRIRIEEGRLRQLEEAERALEGRLLHLDGMELNLEDLELKLEGLGEEIEAQIEMGLEGEIEAEVEGMIEGQIAAQIIMLREQLKKREKGGGEI